MHDLLFTHIERRDWIEFLINKMVIPATSRKEQVRKLIDRKDEIERIINDHGQILIANNNIGMSESLTDENGFPRNDIDVYQVRHARHAIICLQNDLNVLMKEIEEGLIAVHAEAAINCDASTKMANMDLDKESSESENSSPSVAIIKVTLVSPGSPAELAGIRENDAILEFGSVNESNFKDLAQIGEIVKHRQNQQVIIKARRNNRVHELILVPKVWAGRGLLGCNIVLAN